jgi:hypothetical protein
MDEAPVVAQDSLAELTKQEHSERAACERTIGRDLKSFVEVRIPTSLVRGWHRYRHPAG